MKTEWLVSGKLSYCPHCTMSLGLELSAVVLGPHIHLILVLVIFLLGLF
jgi:hypothetical protein